MFIKRIVTTTNSDWMSHIQKHTKYAHKCIFYITQQADLMLGNHKHAAADRSVYLTTHLTHAAITKITAMQGLSQRKLEFIKSKSLKLRLEFGWSLLHISDFNTENNYIELKSKICIT